MNPRTLFFLCLLIAPVELFAQHFQAKGCDLQKKFNAETSLTFYGDSRGDLVSSPLYGESIFDGWLPYLDVGSDQDWNVQNLATVAMTTRNLYEQIVTCNNVDNFAGYITAKRYAVEIGGNDAVYNTPVVIFMPWRIPKTVHWIHNNQRKVVYLMKLALEKRGIPPGQTSDHILVMGSFPAIARGPVAGTPKEQCFYGPGLYNIMCDPPLFFDYTDPAGYDEKLRGDRQEALYRSAEGFYNNQRGSLETLAERNRALLVQILGSDTYARMFGNNDDHNAAFQAYLNWIRYNTEGNSLTTLTSFLIMGVAQLERGFPNDPDPNFRAQHLELYPYFVSLPDCLSGACWVAEKAYFRDVVHPNWRGYAVWGAHLGGWLATNGWQTAWQPPAPPTAALPPQPPPAAEIPPADEEDLLWLIGLCFLFGICHV